MIGLWARSDLRGHLQSDKTNDAKTFAEAKSQNFNLTWTYVLTSSCEIKICVKQYQFCNAVAVSDDSRLITWL